MPGKNVHAVVFKIFGDIGWVEVSYLSKPVIKHTRGLVRSAESLRIAERRLIDAGADYHTLTLTFGAIASTESAQKLGRLFYAAGVEADR